VRKSFCLFLLFILFKTVGYSQLKSDSVLAKIDPRRFAIAVFNKTKNLEEKIVSKTNTVLEKMQRSEEKIYKKMMKGKDSLFAKAKLSEIRNQYKEIKNSQAITIASLYIPELDSLTTSLKFLDQAGISGKIKKALQNSSALQNRFNYSEQIRKFIKERKEQLKQVFEKTGISRQLKKINKTVYYYSAQIQEYKEILKDPRKIERKALELLSKTKLFQDFMKKNSLFASLFRPQFDPNDPLSQIGMAGLQTRVQVNNLIQQQVANGGAGARQQFNQNIQAAQQQLNVLKAKVTRLGTASSDVEQPEFKVNSQKSKSFFKRLEYGTNFQSQKATNFFPVTTDLGLSLGYKLNDNSIIGIGTSYKLGLGRGWNNIRFTSEGIGLRSYVDLKLKGSLWVSGGYEQNFKTAFADFQQLREKNAWQKSGLVGISKVISLKTKFFKKTNIKLLWDFLSYQQIPRTQAFVFRVGYNF
jgi:hypothetical protein